jgi:hypothetical protein
LFRRFIVDPEIALRLARPEGECLATVSPCRHIQPANDPALPEVRDTVALGDRLIDPIDIDHAHSIIERDIDAAKVSLLIEDPRRELMKLVIAPVTDQFLREIDMDFARCSFGPRRNPAIATVIASTDPDLAVAFMALLISDPVPLTEYSLESLHGGGGNGEP